jgi:rhamnosyltransferase subunit B
LAKILLGWELGAGFGHAARLIRLATALREAGHTPVVALSDDLSTRAVWERSGVEVIGAPRFRTMEPVHSRKETLADVLVGTGHFTAERLVKLGKLWEETIRRINPDLVICDAAPNLALQARGKIPVFTVGAAYSVPPAGRPFPAMFFWRKGPLSEAAQNHERILHQSVNEAAKRMGLAELEYPSDLFGGEEVFVCCLPELDGYSKFRAKPAIGSIDPPIGEVARPTERRGLFAYLAANPDMEQWAAGLAASGVPAEAFLRGVKGVALPASIQLHETPVPLTSVLPEKLLIVHHGGSSTSETALRLGIPQMTIPLHGEQEITGMLLCLSGVGDLLSIGQARSPGTVAERVSRLARDGKVRRTAQQVAQKLAARRVRPAVEVVTEAVGRYV